MSQKIVYQFDRSGYYVGETMADESPLEPGVWLMPARTTATPAPANVQAGKWPRWDGVQWMLANKVMPAAEDPVAKLQAFLAANPDVAAIL